VERNICTVDTSSYSKMELIQEIKMDDMYCTWCLHMAYRFRLENLVIRNHFGELNVDEIIL
jgi:hypothetical protein